MSFAPIDVRDLIGHPGASRRHRVSATLENLGTALARIAGDEPIGGDLLLESVVEGLLVTGSLRGTWALRCARCLTGFTGTFDVTVSELFVTAPQQPTGAPSPGDDEGYELDPAIGLELEQMVRDAIGVELPFSPLCRRDCLGLCEVCGGNRNLGECPGHIDVDPRFAALSDLTFPDD